MTMTENASQLLQALNTAVDLLGLLNDAGPVNRRALAAGFPPAFVAFQFHSNEVSCIQDLRRCFGLGTSVDVRVTPGSVATPAEVRVHITWASGGGSAGEALAQLSHHMEVVQKGAQAEMILNAVVRGMRKDFTALGVAMAELAVERERAIAEFRAQA